MKQIPVRERPIVVPLQRRELCVRRSSAAVMDSNLLLLMAEREPSGSAVAALYIRPNAHLRMIMCMTINLCNMSKTS